MIYKVTTGITYMKVKRRKENSIDWMPVLYDTGEHKRDKKILIQI